MLTLVRRLLVFFLSLSCLSQFARAQTSLAGIYADGQVFLRWTLSPNPVFTYDVYVSATPQSTIASMTLVGRIFPEEATGDRMHNLRPNATLRVPNGSGYVSLTASEGAFAWTPHQAGTLYFAVVSNGQTAVSNTNRVQVSFNYDPVNEPVQPHLQAVGNSPAGYPQALYVLWVDGQSDPSNSRPDFVVGGNQHRNGVPHVFVVTTPLSGLSQGPYPCVFVFHGGEGAYPNFTPGDTSGLNLSLDLSDGIVVTPDDNLYFRAGSVLRSEVTAWFGYVRSFDPFTILGRPAPSNDEVVINYTSRRVFWFRDWLLSPRSPFNVDGNRIAAIGHSAGSRGASHLSRQQPDRFSAVILQCALINFEETTFSPIIGGWSQNLATNINDPATGLPLGIRDVHAQYVRLSPLRDFPYTRMYSGKRDENPAGGWTVSGRSVLDAVNASRMGIVVNWDEREHNVQDWSTDFNDLFDDPAHCDPWPDIGQWTFPIKTERYSAQYLADRFRADASYPGIYDADINLNAAGRQPDPGPGDACSPLGTAWGTWGGYIDWTRETIVDTVSRWECTLFLRGNSSVSIDNAPYPAEKVSLAPRRTQNFDPAPGATVYWILRAPLNGPVVQSGQVTAEAEGAVHITDLIIPREDIAKARIYLATSRFCPSDFNNDGIVDFFDYLDFVAEFSNNSPAADFNGDNIVDFFDYLDFVAAFSSGC